jgi:hypothetical protein
MQLGFMLLLLLLLLPVAAAVMLVSSRLLLLLLTEQTMRMLLLMVGALHVCPMPLLLWQLQSILLLLLLLQRSKLACSNSCVCSMCSCSPVADMGICCISILHFGI